MMIYLIVVGAGFGEELTFRSFGFERLGKLLGRSAWAKAAIVIATSLVFGLAHLPDQGVTGFQQATIVGLVFGAIFAVTGSIALLMIAHTSFDLMALFIIYGDLESRVAHWIFK